MTVVNEDLDTRVLASFERRRAPLVGLHRDAEALSVACRDMAERFRRGGRLLVFGNGAGTTDAQHVAVEFVHPVIVGKPALPALSLVADAATLMGVANRTGIDGVFAHQIGVLARPDDIALGLSTDGRCVNVHTGLRAAADAGLMTMALLGGDGGTIGADERIDHRLMIDSDDPHVVKEGHVSAYHLLWEMVHVFLDDARTGTDVAPEGMGSLYPFLHGGTSDPQTLLDTVTASARRKIEEVIALRAAVATDQGQRLAECATQLAAAFRAGGTLFAFGNGGSSTDAQEVVHTFLDPPPPAHPLPALGLTNDVAVVTALSNDVTFDVVFARQVRAFGRRGDVAIGLSTSGGSHNVLAGLAEAHRDGMITVGLAGNTGGQMAEMSELTHLFVVPSSSVHRIQEVQTTLYHVLWEATAAAMAA